jgi:Fe-S cluster assembly ATP-binding protein
MVKGRIVEEGGPELADRLEDEGYDRFLDPSDVEPDAVVEA